MAEAGKIPLKVDEKTPPRVPLQAPLQAWRPFETLRDEVNRLFDDFGGSLWRGPFRHALPDLDALWQRSGGAFAAVDVAEKDNAYEITAELPGLDEKNIEVTIANGGLTIKGEKKEEKEEKKKDYYLKERRFGSFQRSFALPDSVDPDKIEASFNKGVLTVKLPKKPEAINSEKKIAVKAG